MKDAYSFDLSSEKALESYQNMSKAYHKIFKRLNVQFVVVQADTGAIGGSQSEEFHILAEKGEDELLVSEKGDFSANAEICPRNISPMKNFKGEQGAIEEFATPGITNIEDLAKFLKLQASDLVKILFFTYQKDSEKESSSQEESFAVLCSGDDEINPVKT